MQRDLPPHPSLEHLKKQAKDLLDAHQRREAQAFARIRAAVPAFAGMSDEAIARAPFALHDAQSAIAREHGLKSWADLREAVAARAAAPPLPESILRALMGTPLPDAVRAAIGEAWTRREQAPASAEPAGPDGALPLVAMRDALLVRRALAPIHIGRAASAAAIGAALASEARTIAVFSQRAAETEEVTFEALHPVGCVAVVHARIPEADQRAWVILEGARWVVLKALEQAPGGYLVARTEPFRIEGRDAPEVPALAESLRATTRTLASALPAGERIVAVVDAIEDPAELADLVVANVPVRVEEKARYAAQPLLAERLRIALALATALPAQKG
jgi:Lon protease-like protein